MEYGRIALHHKKRLEDIGRFIMSSRDLDQLSLEGMSKALTMVFKDIAEDNSIKVETNLVDTLEGGKTYAFTVTSDKPETIEYSIKFREYDKGIEFFFRKALLFADIIWVKTSEADIEGLKKGKKWQLKEIG